MEAAIDLVRAAYRTPFRALDLVWMNSPENDGAVALVYDPPQYRLRNADSDEIETG